VNDRNSFSALRWLSVFFILSAVVLLTMQLVRFSRLRSNFPAGLVIAGVPVGQLDRSQAAERLLEVYSVPVELQYGDAVIHLDPSVVGFELDLESMLAAADLERTEESFWIDFWRYLWGERVAPGEVPLDASYSEPRLRTFLMDEISARYDQPPRPAQPVPGTVSFESGSPGTSLNIDSSVLVIENALQSPNRRNVDLPLERDAPPRPSFENLRILLRQTVDQEDFDGLVGLYLMDLQTSQEVHFIYSQQQFLETQPDVAFTAASIIKIPIMVSVYRRVDDNASPEVNKLIQDMIEKSGNDPADWLMEQVIDPTIGPLEVTEDMEEIGLQNTFLAGYFYPGAPLLQRIETPANARPDVDTDPDLYNQTSPTDIGLLLADIYQCAQVGGGTLRAVFPGAITPAECQTMINHLSRNKIAYMFDVVASERTLVAHKHGWVTDINGVINTIGDAGIIYTPGGNYVLVVFLHHPQQLIFDPASELVAELARAVYNFYNLPQS
jgi:hypothetical protein